MVNARVLAAAVAAALGLLLGGGSGAAKGVLARTYDPAPPGAAYETVWAATETTITVRYGGDAEPAIRLPALVRFVDDDGHGPATVTAELHRTGPGEWRGTFSLPHAGRWEGLHQHGPPFALRVLPPERRAAAPPWAIIGVTVAVLGAALAVVRGACYPPVRGVVGGAALSGPASVSRSVAPNGETDTTERGSSGPQ